MILTFDAKHALKLLELSEASGSRNPTLQQLVSAEYWKDDLPADRRAFLDANTEDGFCFKANIKDVDPDKIPAGLMLVGDQGVYLMSNASRDTVISELNGQGFEPAHVAYADEVNPRKMSVDAWYEAKGRSFGGDDGVEFLEGAEIKELLENCVRTGAPLRLSVTPDHIEVLLTPEADGPQP